MRILGYIDHSRIKITVFEDNNKIIVQCEDGLCQQTYKFRMGGMISDMESIKTLCGPDFIKHIESQLLAMASARQKMLSEMASSFDDEFDEII